MGKRRSMCEKDRRGSVGKSVMEGTTVGVWGAEPGDRLKV